MTRPQSRETLLIGSKGPPFYVKPTAQKRTSRCDTTSRLDICHGQMITESVQSPLAIERSWTMANGYVPAADARCHIVLVPGFGGFDALGRVQYYADITRLFQQWKRRYGPLPAVLHYFDNLPTAAVVTRATRLRKYLAKRMARGEILENDQVVLVGHSTGGLDIRQLIWDLHDLKNRRVPVDGGCSVSARAIRRCLKGVVFLSVPHWGTNVADWVYSHSVLRKTVIADLRAAFAGSHLYLLYRIEAGIAGSAAAFSGAEMLLALRDALTEANDHGGQDPSRIADAQEAASELELYLSHMAADFRVINDLTSEPHEGEMSPAHFDDEDRKKELALWNKPLIRTLSYATVGGRPFRFPSRSGCPAPVFSLTNPCDYLDITQSCGLSAGTDVSYRFCYRACAGGPFRWPIGSGKVTRVLGPPPAQPIELWDNDGIVNTASMLWPGCETTLVLADHLDIVGHYRLRPAQPEPAEPGSEPPRTYQSYDSLQSSPLFDEKTFKDVWTEIFFFSAIPSAFGQHKKSQPRSVATAAAAGTGC